MPRFAPIRLAALAAALLSVPLALAPTPAAAQAIPKEEAKPKAKATKSTAKVNLNTASSEALQELTGVGPATAEKIIAGRPYTSVDDLSRAGLSERLIESLRPDVTIGRAASTTAKKATTPKPAADTPSPSTTAKAKKTTLPLDEAKEKAKAKTKAPSSATTAPAGAPVNVNTATAETLQTLPRIGPATARAIIAGRPYKTVDELEKVKGLGPARIDALRPLVTVGAASTAAAPAPAPAAGTTRPSTEPKVKATTAGGAIVNVNTADAEALQTLPGVGPAIAESIIAGRPYKTLADLEEVKGLGEAKVAALKGRVSFSTPAAAPAPATTTARTVEPKPAAEGAIVDVNSADAETLQTLPGVGPAIAESIIAGRPYKTLADLQEVKGLGETKVAALKDRVRFGRAAVTPSAAPAAAPAPATDDLAIVVNVNTADAETLQTLPGVGPAIAESIIAGRPYKTLEDLQNVKGLGEVKVAALKDRVSFGPAARAPRTETVRPSAPSPAPTTRKPVEVEDDLGPIRAEFGQKINLNTATGEELETLLGIGPVRAQAIIDGRPFETIDDVMKVKGIKEKTFAKIKDFIRVK